MFQIGVGIIVVFLSTVVMVDIPEVRVNVFYNEGRAHFVVGESERVVRVFDVVWKVFQYSFIAKKRVEVRKEFGDAEEAIADYCLYLFKLN